MEQAKLGVDIDQAWIMDGEGDLVLVKYDDNVCQAIFNRLSCTMGNLDWVYNNYGSYIKEYIGKQNTPSVRESLRNECEKRLKKDPRLTDCEVDIVAYTEDAIGLHVTGFLDNIGKKMDEYLIIGSEDLYESKTSYQIDGYKDTYIISRARGYAGQPGQKIVVHAHVLIKGTDDLVPIGNINLRIGRYGIGRSIELQQSWGTEPGTVTIAFTIPRYMEYGLHYLTFKYEGSPGYNACQKKVKLLVVPTMPTTTYHNHTRGNTYTHRDDTLFMDVYELGEYGSQKYWEKSSQQLKKDGLPKTRGAIYVEDYNGIPVGYGESSSKGKVHLTMIKKLSDKINTTIKMYEDDDSFTFKQPYLIERCEVRDEYGRDVISGNVNIYAEVGSNIIMASTNPESLSFTTTSLVDHGVYSLVDTNGNLVDNLVANVTEEGDVNLSSTNEQGTEEIIIN